MISVLLFSAAFAADSVNQDLEYLQPNVVVTATQTVETVDDSLATVSVINRELIESSGAQDLLELLRRQTGVDVVRGGGPGGQTSVFMRGTNSNHVLVMVDGIRVASAITGGFAWEHLPLVNIEKIEIVRGPRAAVHGSDAIGGVIQIFTRRDSGSFVQLGAGSDDTFSATVGTSFQTDDSQLRIQAGHRDVGGFSSQNSQGFSFDPDADGFEQSHVDVSGHRQRADHRFGFAVGGVKGQSEFDQGVSTTDRYRAAVDLSGPLSTLRYLARVSYFDETLETPAFFSRFDVQRHEIDGQLMGVVGPTGQWIVGVDHVAEEGASIDLFSGSDVYAADRENLAVHGGLQVGQSESWRPEMDLSARYDDNSEFGGKATGGLALAWGLGDRWRLVSSYGTSFRAPSLSEQYSPGFDGLFAGNPDLQPEESGSAEISLAGRSVDGQHRMRLALFDTRIDDLIAFSGSDFQAINIARAHIQGAEWEYDFAAEEWELGLRATWQDPEDEDTGQPLLRRPQRKFGVVGHRQLGPARVGFEGFYSSERADFGTELADYSLFNLYTSWNVTPRWTLTARLDNATDKDYQLAQGFNTQDRSLQVLSRFRF